MVIAVISSSTYLLGGLIIFPKQPQTPKQYQTSYVSKRIPRKSTCQNDASLLLHQQNEKDTKDVPFFPSLFLAEENEVPQSKSNHWSQNGIAKAIFGRLQCHSVKNNKIAPQVQCHLGITIFLPLLQPPLSHTLKVMWQVWQLPNFGNKNGIVIIWLKGGEDCAILDVKLWLWQNIWHKGGLALTLSLNWLPLNSAQGRNIISNCIYFQRRCFKW